MGQAGCHPRRGHALVMDRHKNQGGSQVILPHNAEL
jgi:hypothetical protein